MDEAALEAQYRERERKDEATLKAQYREKARIKEQVAAEKVKCKEQLEEAAFLYRLKHWNLYPHSPRRCVCVWRGGRERETRLRFCKREGERDRARKRENEREEDREVLGGATCCGGSTSRTKLQVRQRAV